MAKLEAYLPVKKKRLGAMKDHGFVLPYVFFDSLPEEELRLWEGEEE